jgi:uncharacterized membrane-anchored protein YhcB (DUF1043 family)
MGYERIVVVKEQKRGGFWPFVGGVVLGAIVVKTIHNMNEKKRIERELEEKQPNIEPAKTQKELTLERETMMVEDLIDELVSKRNKTQKDKDNLDLLRIKLEQLRNG